MSRIYSEDWLAIFDSEAAVSDSVLLSISLQEWYQHEQ